MLQPLHAVVLPGPGPGVVQLGGQGLIEHLIDQAGLSGSGNAGDADEGPQRNGHVHILQIVLPSAPHREEVAAAGPPAGGDRDFLHPGQVLPRQGPGAGHDVLQGSGCHNLPSVDAGTRTHIHDEVRRPHGVLVMLHHHQGVAQIPQPAVVPLVQTNGGLVQDIQDPHEG